MTPPISTIIIGGPGWVPSGDVYKLNLGNLVPHAVGSTFFVVQVAGKPASGNINSVLQIGYDNSLGNDPNPVDNVSTDSDSIAVVDLIVSANDFKSNVVISSTNTYSVTTPIPGSSMRPMSSSQIRFQRAHATPADQLGHGLATRFGSTLYPVWRTEPVVRLTLQSLSAAR